MSSIDSLSEALVDELDASDATDIGAAARPFVDPRTIPTRHSLLKKMSLSPAHYLEAAQRDQDDSLAARLGAAGPDKKDYLRFGHAVHELLLGNDAKVARFTGSVRRGKVWEDFRARSADRGAAVIVNEREFGLATAIASAVRGNPTAVRLLFEDTIVEQRIDWQWLDRDVRSTPDARRAGHTADLKTAQTAQPSVFARLALRLHYHAQAALYAQAIEAAREPTADNAYLIAVEKSRPYPVTILRFTDAALEVGARLNRLWFERLQLCEQTNDWPEYAAGIVDLDLPETSFGLEIDGKRVEF